ncbi:16S rRNA (adenine(1518)-N(6)/adenine(1519)-N(6)) -dimethyltransferase RsmA [Rugosimonospora acidiphila]|uniref:Ribosomal RNA small subunit methyltransferase A n=1 Tax=Rugosimonospora acidiphila TaxID=556531 RepID=A0ABP9SB83_9ACTN
MPKRGPRSGTVRWVTVTGLLGPAEIRELSGRLGVVPTKTLGQNFVHDPNTVRRIVRAANLDPADVVIEVGPGLGSLTLGLLPATSHVYAIEIDPVLAGNLADTVAQRDPGHADRLTIINRDALKLSANDLRADQQRAADARPADPRVGDVGAGDVGAGDVGAGDPGAGDVGAGEPGQLAAGAVGGPTALVANLPYNVAVPVVLHLLAVLPSLRHGLVMVQKEVADRLTAGPGSRVYGVPSVKLAWYATARPAGRVPPSVFWPVPNVDSGLVAFAGHRPPAGADRRETFAVIDHAFAQRRKTLRAALAQWAGGADAAAEILVRAGVDPRARGESLTIEQFAAIAAARAGEAA